MVTTVKPHAADDFDSFYEDAMISGNLLANDTAGANGNKFLRFFDGENVLAKKVGQITDIEGEYGTFHVKADGSYTYDLKEDVKGALEAGQTLVEKIDYKISDGSGNTDVGRFALEIKGVTDGPVPQAILMDFETGTHYGTLRDYAGFDFASTNQGDHYGMVLYVDEWFASLYPGIAQANQPGGHYVISSNITDKLIITRPDGADFDFNSAAFGAQYGNPDLHVMGSKDGVVVYDFSVNSVDGSVRDLDIKDVDTVVVQGTYGLIMDNLSFSGTWLV